MPSLSTDRPTAATNPRTALRVHALDTGRLVANKTFLRGEGFASLLRRVEMVEFPVLVYVIEHPEGLIVVDTGLASTPPRPRTVRGFPPRPLAGGDRDVASRMHAIGLDPRDVSTVVLTHLDWDHTGGLRHFGHASVLVHRPEMDFARTRVGAFRYLPSTWPANFRPTLYDLEPEPFGPFPTSRAITSAGDVRLVPLPGHTPGQVGVAVADGAVTLLMAADHMLREDWLIEDLAAHRLLMLGPYRKQDARRTSERLQWLVRSRPTVVLPAHDADAPARLRQRLTTMA